MKILIQACFAAASLGWATSAISSPTIELKDGSRIQGDIQSIDNGVYAVHSASIGTVHIAQSNIVRIVYVDDAPPVARSPDKSPARDDTMTREMQQLQTSLAKDPAALQSIMSLESDPQIEAVLNDPAIAKAIQEGDYASLLANPKIQALENNEHVKQVVQQQAH